MLEKSKNINSDLVVIKFLGEWFDEQNSKGTLLYKNGGKYIGEIRNMKRHGQGEYKYPILQDQNELKKMYILKPMVWKGEFYRKSFSGEWNADEKVKGTIIYKDGEKYEGQLFEDVPHGKGV